MASIYEGGDEAPTPRQTVVELLTQGYTTKDIITEAEANIATAQAGIAWVDAILAEQVAGLDNGVRSFAAAQEAINQAIRGGASPDVIKEAEKAVEDASFHARLQGINASDAKAAAEQHRAHASETIANAQARIAAANDPKIKGDVEKRAAALKAADAKANAR